jgi:hypothetical protein
MDRHNENGRHVALETELVDTISGKWRCFFVVRRMDEHAHKEGQE